MSAIQTWIDADALSNNPEIASRNVFARKNHEYSPTKIVENYNYLTLDELKAMIEFFCKDLNLDLQGIGVDLGAGVSGMANSFLSLYPAIEKIYAVEIVPDVVTMLQKKITKHLGNEDRIVSVIGSFDDIKLPDNSVDFIIEFDSLHHSFDLDKTLIESRRVLKPGGKLIVIDRVHFNYLSQAQREYMLNAEYGENFKLEYGLPLDSKLTRGENGEHEISEQEWRNAFNRAGLKVAQRIFYHRRCFRAFAFALISQIPFTIRRKYTFYPMLVKFPLSFLLMYVFPFVKPSVWDKRFRLLNMKFGRREAAIFRSVFVIEKPI